MAKKVDPLKAKQKRQKMIAAVGGVLLVGLLAFQVPRVMKQLNKKAPAPPVASTTTAAPASGTPPLAAPTLVGSAQPASSGTAPASTGTSAGGDGVTSGDAAPPPQEGQLTSFSRFASKDPFAQQVADSSSASAAPSAGSAAGSASSGGGSAAAPSGGAGLSRAPSVGGSGAAPAPSSGVTGSAPAPGGAVISVNGAVMSVTVGTDFPAAGTDPNISQPVFHLVSVTAHTAKISIAGGSYASGARTVTLRENKPVTLMNTADGTRYRLILKPQGTPVTISGVTAKDAPTSPTTTPSP